jgi:hypothetical protein
MKTLVCNTVRLREPYLEEKVANYPTGNGKFFFKIHFYKFLAKRAIAPDSVLWITSCSALDHVA